MKRTVPSRKPGLPWPDCPLREMADCGDRSSLDGSSRGLVRDLESLASLVFGMPLGVLTPLLKTFLVLFCVKRGYLLAAAS